MRPYVFIGLLMLVLAAGLIFWPRHRSAEALVEVKTPPTELVGEAPRSSRSGAGAGNAVSESGSATPERRRTTQPGAEGKVDAEMDRLLSDDRVSQRDATIGLVDIACNRKVASEKRVDALQHALNLTPDREHKELIRAWLENGSFESEQLQRVLLDDAFNRDEVVKLPTAYALMDSTHPDIAKDATELMGFVLEVTEEEKKRGNVPWKQRMDEYMAARNLQP